MLVDMMTGQRITKVPFKVEYDRWKKLMSEEEIASIKAALNAKIEGTEIQTSSWMPGQTNFTGTPYQAIHDKAARGSWDATAKCFGLMVWEVFMERPEVWTSEHFELNGKPLRGRTYFKIRDQP